MITKNKIDKETIPKTIPETIPALSSKYGKRVSNLIKRLNQTKQILISKRSKKVKAYCYKAEGLSTGKRLALFDDKRRIGYLDFYDEANEIWYTGELPISSFARMIYADNKREDCWALKFP